MYIYTCALLLFISRVVQTKGPSEGLNDGPGERPSRSPRDGPTTAQGKGQTRVQGNGHARAQVNGPTRAPWPRGLMGETANDLCTYISSIH